MKARSDAVQAALRKLDKQGTLPVAEQDKLLADLAALREAAPALGHELTGRYHCLKGEAGPCRAEYGLALQLEPENPKLLSGYGASLCRMHCLPEGLSFLLKARACGGRDLLLLNRLIYTLYQLDQPEALAEYFAEYTALTGERHEIEDWE
ncbi:hypothetical protein LJC36_02135 [Desulfovibrio sp. OttesenSCG-928-C14]|nr:hypothetical protein [Desulfovibrio sp. OttesenSCG-928-C14]